MASIRKQRSGAWRVQVRRKGRTLSETFVRYDDAKKWGVDAERQIDRGETPTLARTAQAAHVRRPDRSARRGKPPRRSKAATLKMLKSRLGSHNMADLDRERILNFGRERAAEGAGPMTAVASVGLAADPGARAVSFAPCADFAASAEKRPSEFEA